MRAKGRRDRERERKNRFRERELAISRGGARESFAEVGKRYGRSFTRARATAYLQIPPRAASSTEGAKRGCRRAEDEGTRRME